MRVRSLGDSGAPLRIDPPSSEANPPLDRPVIASTSVWTDNWWSYGVLSDRAGLEADRPPPVSEPLVLLGPCFCTAPGSEAQVSSAGQRARSGHWREPRPSLRLDRDRIYRI